MGGMAGDEVPAWPVTTDEQRQRWADVLDHLAAAVPAGAASVVVDDLSGHGRTVADRLADRLRAAGRPCARLSDTVAPADEDAGRGSDTVVIADGSRRGACPPGGTWDVVIWLRTSAVGRIADGDRGDDADIVVDLRDRAWPVIRHLHPRLSGPDTWYLTESRAFFAPRAATWDTRFGGDLPAYAAAVGEADLAPGAVVVDVGCGTGRALPALRAAVGRHGTVVGLDVTPQMLAVARARHGSQRAGLVLADARGLPLADASVDAVFAAGLLTHLPDTDAALRELARVTRTGGRLVLFHPSGRAALAARHGRALRPDEPLAEAPLRQSTGRTGWQLGSYDDPPHRFLALAVRR